MGVPGAWFCRSREPSLTQLAKASCSLAGAFPGVSTKPTHNHRSGDAQAAASDLHLEAEGRPSDLKALDLEVHPNGGLVVMVEDILAEPVGPRKLSEATCGGGRPREVRPHGETRWRWPQRRAMGTGHRQMEPPARAPWAEAATGGGHNWGQDGERPRARQQGGQWGCGARGPEGRLTIARLPGGRALCTPAISPISCIPSQRPRGLHCDLGLGLPGRPNSGAERGWPAAHLWMRQVLPT